jgi:hypothetical protein
MHEQPAQSLEKEDLVVSDSLQVVQNDSEKTWAMVLTTVSVALAGNPDFWVRSFHTFP